MPDPAFDPLPAADRSAERDAMVEQQLAARGITDPRVLDAMRELPRERFVPPESAGRAYRDTPLPIGEGQTISQPFMVALMLQEARLGGHDRVLEVGAGSGYAAALMSRLAARVHAIERHPSLVETALERLRWLGCANVELKAGDGTLGWPEAAPFDAILVAAGGPQVPETLREQLAIGGRLVMPVGDRSGAQELVVVTRLAKDRYDEQVVAPVRFVPLIGEHGWAGSRSPGGADPAAAPSRPPIPPPD